MAAVNPEPTEASITGLHGKPHHGIAGVRLRVLALLLAMQAAILWWVADSEIARSVYLLCYSLMMPTVMYLLLVRIVRRWLPFEDRELLLVYIVLTATLPIVGFGAMRFLVPGMGYMPFFVNLQPQFAKYLSHLTNLPLLQDPQAISNLFKGGASVPWRAWIIPICFWSLYLLLLNGIWIGMAGILRRIWIHQERLTFPIAVLPLQLSDPHEDIFKSWLFWAGVAVPAILQSLLAFHDWFPSIPAFQLKGQNVRPLIFTEPPWSAIPDIAIGFYPMAIGLAFFVPSDVSFSCWFFWLMTKLSYVVAWQMGIEAAGTGAMRFPYRDEQAAGAWIALALIIAWGTRYHWKTVAKAIPQEERTAAIRLGGFGATCAVLCILMMYLVGVPFIVSMLILGVYAALVLAGARIRATAGCQWTFAPLGYTPFRSVTSSIGTENLTDKGMLTAGYFDLVHVDIRGQNLPYLMEGLKISESVGLKWRTVLTWIGIGLISALVLGWWSTLSKVYSVGAATAKSNVYIVNKVQIALNQMDRLVINRSGPDTEGIMAMTFAGLLTVLLSFLRSRSLAFPFHPIGYVLCNTHTMNSFFVPFFMAWSVKVLLLRFGGAKAYRRGMPFFVGLVLGDVVIQGLWAMIGGIFNVPIYQFLT